ncbi:uncharacterized protein CPUR_02977 [Claviceps purpurea 20.1]|uniref:Uncharacterized protein n=1 Tax=Claviceps purpurea (strain 20.1) TaxID=1111077 RepID=M1WD52_CLAP2|nr:uncharacterized protein CPUR_02977 [Claviceps purpurea 20.1]
MNSPVNDSMYVLQDIPGKGKGLVATRNIPRGTRILSEQPLITLPTDINSEKGGRSIRRQLKALSVDKRRAFLLLHNAHQFDYMDYDNMYYSYESDDAYESDYSDDIIDMYENYIRNKDATDILDDDWEQCIGIFSTNVLSMNEGNRKQGGIFLEACRINYDCDNNVMHYWNDETKRQTVHAIRDINAGEELTMSYLVFLLNRESRQRLIKLSSDFTCFCRLCSLPDEQSEKRDRKMEQIVRLGDRCKLIVKEFPLQTLLFYHAQMCIYSELGRGDSDSAQVYELAADLTIAHGDLARTRVFAQKAASIWTTVTGSDNPQVIKLTALASHPTTHPSYSFSMDWKTAVDDIPQGLDPNDFENWLWKRVKRQIPKGQGQSKSITTQSLFSGFVDLPFTRGFDANGPSKKRHYCLLGEIIGSIFLLHLGIVIKDIHGYKVPLHVYTKSRGKDLMPNEYQRGYTVALLDPLQYLFKDGNMGIRLEDPQMIKIFPLSLAKMIELNEQVRKYSIRQHNDMRTCHGCGTDAAATSMKRCGKCLSFWYCTKVCQIAGWTTKAHKGDCKFLRDPDLRGLFLIKWDEVQDCISFPLKVADESI